MRELIDEVLLFVNALLHDEHRVILWIILLIALWGVLNGNGTLDNTIR